MLLSFDMQMWNGEMISLYSVLKGGVKKKLILTMFNSTSNCQSEILKCACKKITKPFFLLFFVILTEFICLGFILHDELLYFIFCSLKPREGGGHFLQACQGPPPP